MMEERKVPALRFQGLADKWEQVKLGNLAIFNPKVNLPDTFEYVDLESVVGTEMISHRKESKKTAPSRAQRLASKGDLFYQNVRPYQKNNYLFELQDKNYVFSTGYTQLRPRIDNRFLLSLVQSDGFVRDVLSTCTGTSYPAVNSNALAEIEVYYPINANEQKKVGEYFSLLDRLIIRYKHQLYKLQVFKKSMLEKMFPRPCEKVPEFRFRGFTGDWEEKKLGELVSITSGYMGDSLLSDGKYRLTRIETISDGIVDETHIGYTNVKPDSFYLLRKGDILYSNINSLAHIGKIAMYEGDSILYHGINLLRLRPTAPLDSHFLMALLNTSQCRRWARSRANQAVNQASINQVLLASQSIKICSLIEQKQIGLFFRRLDIIITMQQRKLKKLYSLKQAMLSEMFI